MTSSDAQSTIANLDLRYNVIEASSDQPKGTVIKQSPTSGQAKKGDTITITVSSGPASNPSDNGQGNGNSGNGSGGGNEEKDD